MEDRRAKLAAARRQIAPLTDGPARTRLALGCAPIDARLKGGLDAGALHEVAAADHRASPAALGFLLALARIATARNAAGKHGPLIWPLAGRAGEFGSPYAPGLKALGLDPAGFVFLRCKRREDVLWAMEEALRLGGVGAVVGTRPRGMDLTASRRLQLAAEAAAIPIFLFRPHQDDEASAAATRWRIAPQRAAQDGLGFFDRPRWQAALERVRGGRPGEWVVEFDHDALCLRLPAGLGSAARQEAAGRTG